MIEKKVPKKDISSNSHPGRRGLPGDRPDGVVDGDAQEAHDEGVGDAAEQGGDAEALQAKGLPVLLAKGQEDRHADACRKKEQEQTQFEDRRH